MYSILILFINNVTQFMFYRVPYVYSSQIRIDALMLIDMSGYVLCFVTPFKSIYTTNLK